MTDIVRDEDQIGRLRAREIADAPGIDLDHLAGMLDLHAGVDERRDLDVAASRRKLVGGQRAASLRESARGWREKCNACAFHP